MNKAALEEYVFVSHGAARMELIRDMVNEYVVPAIKKSYCPHFCIEVTDTHAALAAECKNITIIRGPLNKKGEETWVHFADEGNSAGIYSMIQ